MLQATDLSFAYRQTSVLSGVEVRVSRGGLVGILGPNGSGKTTLLRLLAGTLQPVSGQVTLDGLDLRAIPRRELARHVAVVPQETHLAFDYTALEVALMGRYPHLGAFELEGPTDFTIAREALAATGTLAFEDRSLETLSGGEKQRVIIASALAQFPPGPQAARPRLLTSQVLLLDEPTASLDLGYQLEVATVLRRLNHTRAISIVVATHDLNFAASLCTHLVLIRGGRVLETGETEQVLREDTVRALYGVDADVRYHQELGHVTVTPRLRVVDRPSPVAGR